MDDEYKILDVENNVKVAVKKLREAYFAKDAPLYANQFCEAKMIIISAICFQDYTLEKEGGKNDGYNHNGDNLRNACNAGSDRQREKEEVTDELYGIHDFIVDMLCGSDLTAEERNTVERIRQRVLDGIRNISKR